MNAFEAANHYISKASRIMNLGPRVERLLLSLEAEHHVTIPIERDNGELAVFSGYRFQHNSARGPTKGGLRFHPTVDADDVRAVTRTTARAVAAAPGGTPAPAKATTLREFKETAERDFLVGKLREFDWNISRTAEVIDTPRSNLYKKLEQYGIKSETDS